MRPRQDGGSPCGRVALRRDRPTKPGGSQFIAPPRERRRCAPAASRQHKKLFGRYEEIVCARCLDARLERAVVDERGTNRRRFLPRQRGDFRRNLVNRLLPDRLLPLDLDEERIPLRLDQQVNLASRMALAGCMYLR